MNHVRRLEATEFQQLDELVEGLTVEDEVVALLGVANEVLNRFALGSYISTGQATMGPSSALTMLSRVGMVSGSLPSSFITVISPGLYLNTSCYRPGTLSFGPLFWAGKYFQRRCSSQSERFRRSLHLPNVPIFIYYTSSSACRGSALAVQRCYTGRFTISDARFSGYGGEHSAGRDHHVRSLTWSLNYRSPGQLVETLRRRIVIAKKEECSLRLKYSRAEFIQMLIRL